MCQRLRKATTPRSYFIVKGLTNITVRMDSLIIVLGVFPRIIIIHYMAFTAFILNNVASARQRKWNGLEKHAARGLIAGGPVLIITELRSNELIITMGGETFPSHSIPLLLGIAARARQGVLSTNLPRCVFSFPTA